MRVYEYVSFNDYLRDLFSIAFIFCILDLIIAMRGEGGYNNIGIIIALIRWFILFGKAMKLNNSDNAAFLFLVISVT